MTPVVPPSLWYGKVTINSTGVKNEEKNSENDDSVHVVWHQVTSAAQILHSEIQRRVDSLKWEVLLTQPTDSSYTDLPFDSILVYPPSYTPSLSPSSSSSPSASPATRVLPPIILIPHGGPHGSFSTSFYMSSVYFACAGLATLHVNYRGSTGYGQASLTSLRGKCGNRCSRLYCSLHDVIIERIRSNVMKSELLIHGDLMVAF